MDSYSNIRIIGTGHDVPRKYTNSQVFDIAPTLNGVIDEKWVEDKIKIQERYSSLRNPYEHENPGSEIGYHNSDLCVRAIQKAHGMAKHIMGDLSNLDAIFYSSCTPDYPLPPTSAIIMEKLGLNDIFTMDIRSACSGSSLGLMSALQYLKTGEFTCAAIVGCETGSPYGNLDFTQPYSDKQHIVNAFMIGDAAACVIIKRFESSSPSICPSLNHGIEIRYIHCGCIGKGKDFGMYLPAGGSVRPFGKRVLDEGAQYFRHDFVSVLKNGPALYVKALQELKKVGVSHEDVELIIPHQANGMVVDIAKRIGVDGEKIHEHFSMYGNTANASILLGLDLEVRRGELENGKQVVLIAAESTKWLYSVILLRWTNIGDGVARL